MATGATLRHLFRPKLRSFGASTLSLSSVIQKRHWKQSHRSFHSSSRLTPQQQQQQQQSSSFATQIMVDDAPFPVEDLVPKKETNVLQFLQEHPTFDGRGVVIGILDTGIDPNATGMQYLPDGKTPKLIDIVDCSGSGDVDMSTIVNLKDGGDDDTWTVEGLSGRTLYLSKKWNIQPLPVPKDTFTSEKSTEEKKEDKGTTSSSSGKDAGATKATNEKDDTQEESSPPSPGLQVRLGIKRAFELFPAPVITRAKAHRKQVLEQELHDHVVELRQKLASLPSSSLTPSQIKQRDDWQARVEVLTDSTYHKDDPGILLDCVTFWNGTEYCAVIDSSETGKLQDLTPMQAFRKNRQYSTISIVDQYNYGVNFYDEGSVLSIVGDISPHGTHVAGIAAAAQEERSGVAPGAQLISLKIGDSRMSGMETGTAIIRGMMEAVRLGCNVINLSYGEGTQLPNSGRVIACAEELVWRHNVIFVSSAGNNGPALTTVGAPGGTTSPIISVAAYVSPDMMKANYSLASNNAAEDELVGTTYTWSSVGPTTDGHNGVNICAPGGAITSVSNWTLQKSRLMNGTSMSSPHACGCVALLLSACLQEGIPISPPRIQRALENTAKDMGLSRMQQGAGMVQVDKAFEYLKAYKDVPFEDVSYDVRIDGRAGNPRGIYLRQSDETSIKQTFGVSVSPRFQRKGVDIEDDHQKERISFEMMCALKSSAEWVTVPDHFMLMNNGRVFKINVDPTDLPAGVHTAEVLGYDSHNPDRGPIWTVPITVVKPLDEHRAIVLGELEFDANEVKRYFVTPPLGSTWMDVTIEDSRIPTDKGGASKRMFVLHTVQLIPHAAYRDYEKQKYLHLLPTQQSVTSIPVESGVTSEVTIGRFWSNSGPAKVKVSIEFRGVRPVPDSFSMNAGDTFVLARVHSELQDESISPSAKFTKWKTPIRPKQEGVISPLGERDIQPWNKKKIHQLVLNYEFTQEEKEGGFIPRAPALQGVLYESGFESQVILAFDSDKKYLGYCDAYPRQIQAPKGTVILRVQIRHEDPVALEKLKDMIIWIERKLEKDLAVSAYENRESLVLARTSMKKRLLRKGNTAAVFFAEPNTSKLPTGCKKGDILIGSATFAGGDATLPGEGKRPNGFPLSFNVGPKLDKPSSEDLPEPKDERTVEEKLAESIRDAKVSMLEKLSTAEKEEGKFEHLFESLEKEYPDHLPLLVSNLKYLDEHAKRSDMIDKVLSASDNVISKISEDALALHFGKNVDKEDPEKVKINKEMEKKKNHLIEALTRKALALIDLKKDDSGTKFDETLNKLKEWVDIDANGKYATLAIERDCRDEKYGSAIKRIQKLLSKASKESSGGIKTLSKSDLLKKRSEIFEKLGYTALVDRDKAMRVVAAPKDFPLF